MKPIRPIQFAWVAVIFSLIQWQCKNNQTAARLTPSLNAYVYAYTSGIISKAAPVRIKLAAPAIKEDQTGETPASSVLNFSPSMKGTLSWEDTQTLRFEPEGYWQPGQVYQASLQLRKLLPEIPAADGAFQFDFRIRDPHLEVSLNGLSVPNTQDYSKMALSGTVTTSDVAEPAEVEQVLSAKQGGKALAISWNHQEGDATNHPFVVQAVERGKADSEVTLYWNGKPLNAKAGGEQTVTVPAQGTFIVLDARGVLDNDAYIQLIFSDPLQASQDLDGLIRLGNFNGSLRYGGGGNQGEVYPGNRLVGDYTVQVDKGVKNSKGTTLTRASEWSVSLGDNKPLVRLVGDGVIVPHSEGLLFPFEAISLNAVEVEVFKIFNNNILQFLQSNELDGDYEMERVGRIIAREKGVLRELNSWPRPTEWSRPALAFSRLVEDDPMAIYQVRIGFRPAYAAYPCSNQETEAADELTQQVSLETSSEDPVSFWDDWYGIEGYYEGYSWDQREDPCYPAYYSSGHFIRRNVLVSDLGIIAKGSDANDFFVAVTDLRTTGAVSGAQLEFYDYQQQLLATTQTDGQGIANVKLPRTPFVVVASQGDQKGYLRLQDGNALSMSRFDVSGAATQKGLKGMIYGERGVWRPGDSLHLNFILEDAKGQLPENYPITFELSDARGQLFQKKTITHNVGRVYDLATATPADAATGNWLARVKAGGATFEKVLKIETVKPNRLKIQLDFGKENLTKADEPVRANLQVNWLHGAPASNLKAVIESQLRPVSTKFPKYDDFSFDDPARRLESEPIVFFEGSTDASGSAVVSGTLLKEAAAPGRLSANFRTRVFENGGDFSTDNQSLTYDPYNAYAGVALPKRDFGEKRLDIGKASALDFVALSSSGQPLAGHKLSIGLYRVEWRWWWDRDEYDNVSRYNSSGHIDAQERITLTTDNKGQARWNVTVNNWGRYLVRVCDETSGHCGGDFFYAGYPWYGEDDSNNKSALAMLAFASDKPSYKVGETVSLKVPAGEKGRILLTLENGSSVLESRWQDAKAGDNVVEFRTTSAMTPTIYAHVELIQPHAQVQNDLPIRMYGIIPINVEDPATKLEPTIKMPETLKPESSFKVEVAEKNGKPMTYTLAVVDEGLLDLTRFKTPNPHDVFFAREALGIKTWDVYDYVLGAYGGSLERVLGIGGDGAVEVKNPEDKANRFPPVVKHLGPFQLGKGKKASHEINMPNYVGSVRVMVVASSEHAYGSAEKAVPVRKPLMVLATLPRVLGPGEQLRVPVSVFAMEDKIKNANITLETDGKLVQLTGANSQSLSFARPGEEMAFFDIAVKEGTGIAKFKIKAQGSGEQASQEIEVDVRNPNPMVTNVMEKVLEKGQNWTTTFAPVGMTGSNTGVLEVSSIPPINLSQRLQYLLQYPHGCIEQTTSAGFPQLLAEQLIPLDDKQKAETTRNIKATIERIKQFQTSQGGFAYWPGETDPSPWGSNYAGHFLLEAQARGYAVPSSLIDRWKKYQQTVAKRWDPRASELGLYSAAAGELDQAYRLYTLALAKAPENGAMNRLREKANLSNTAKWRLAAAYALAGKTEVAKELAKGLTTQVTPYNELAYTYGSDTRDEAMILETLLLLGDKTQAATLLRDVAGALGNGNWMSTQTIAYSLLAVGKYAGENKISDRYTFSYKVGNGQAIDAGSTTPVMNIQVPVDGNANRSLSLTNSGNNTLFVRLILSGQPVAGGETAANNQLNINVRYKNTQGQPVDPAQLRQGTDFVAEVVVSHPGTRSIPYQE